jgi:hypothetical protein
MTHSASARRIIFQSKPPISDRNSISRRGRERERGSYFVQPLCGQPQYSTGVVQRRLLSKKTKRRAGKLQTVDRKGD